MKLAINALVGGAALLGVLVAIGVQAINYSVWINGRTGGGQLGKHDDFTYFGPGTVNGGVNKKSATSSGGLSGTSGSSYCNPSDWFCNDLTQGTASNQGGRAKWANHSVKFRDDGETVNHYNQGSWAGIVGKVRADLEANAR